MKLQTLARSNHQVKLCLGLRKRNVQTFFFFSALFVMCVLGIYGFFYRSVSVFPMFCDPGSHSRLGQLTL